MKKCILLLTVLCVAVAFATAIAEAPDTPLTVGNTTPMRGSFFSGQWGNATSDVDVRELIHGYNLIMWDGEQGMFMTDPSVVSGTAVMENEQGDRTYVLVLYDDLFFSDGSKITAWDYAFSYLLQLSPAMAELGGSPEVLTHLQGAEAYRSGQRSVLTGVRVTADDTISVTIDHASLPFFYEMGLLDCKPYPISVLAPGVAVMDDGEGVYLVNTQNPAEPALTAALLSETLLNPDTGYQSHPTVTCGAYVLTDWDGVTASFTVNPYYKGNAYGELPSIESLVYTHADNETMMAELAAGNLDILNKVTNGATIMQGMMQMGTVNQMMSNYPRSGLAFIGFDMSLAGEESLPLRQAIAWSTDREQVVADYVSNFGAQVNGLFGIGQWMYGLVMGTTAVEVEKPADETDAEAMVAYDEEVAAWDALTLNNLIVYAVDLERAADLLDEAGYPLTAAGNRGLTLTLGYPEGNVIGAVLAEAMGENLSALGVRLETVPMSLQALSQAYYGGTGDCDMYFLATNFDTMYNPALYVHDEELTRLAAEMSATQPGDVLAYAQKWQQFQEVLNAKVAALPLYSNIYFDFYRADLQHYMIGEHITWSGAIVGAYLGEPEELEALTFDDEDDGLVEFD